jgi:hypothetical protein
MENEKVDEITRMIETYSSTEKITELKEQTQQTQQSEQDISHIINSKEAIKGIILKEISDFSPHCEILTLSTLLAISQWKSVLNIGGAGQGKSRSSLELLDLLKIPYSEIKGHVTPPAFYNEIVKDGIIIIDESANILENREIQGMLLDALLKKEVKWQTSRKNKSHDFKGIIICNTNKFNGSNQTKQAIMDRVFVNRINLTGDQIIHKIKHMDYKPNMDIWYAVIERLGLLEISKETDLGPLDDRLKDRAIYCENKLFKSLNDKGGQVTALKEILLEKLIKNKQSLTSTRAWEKIVKTASFSIDLLGDISLVDSFIAPIVNDEERLSYIVNLPTTRQEKVTMIHELQGYKERGSARRMLRKIEESAKC